MPAKRYPSVQAYEEGGKTKMLDLLSFQKHIEVKAVDGTAVV